MAAERARGTGGEWVRTGLAWASLGVPPLLLRGLALWELDAAPGGADALGFVSDAAMAGLAVALVWCLARLHVGLAVVAAVASAAFYYLNYETVRALRAIVNLADAAYLGDATFVGGSLLAPAHPLLLCCLLVAAGVAARRGFSGLRGGVAAALAGAGAAMLAGAAWLAAEVPAEPWRRGNAILHNARWSVEPGPSGASDLPGPLALVPDLLADLGGAPRFAFEGSGRNVLLVVLEGVSGADIESVARFHRRTATHPMRRLDRLYRENVGFATFVNHNRRTDRGLYALLCGALPNLGQGLSQMTVGASGVSRSCLPRRLRDHGYRTAYLQAAPLGFMAKGQFMPRAGFEQVLGADAFEPHELRTLWGVDDDALFARASSLIEELRGGGDPWFLTLLTVGTHHPYVVPPGVAGGTGARAAFAFLDAALGRFVDRLAEAGVLDDTLVLITSDEAAGLWPGTSDGVAAALTQNWGFLVALLPERVRAQVATPYAQADVALSVLDYLGRADAIDGLHGRSLFREPEAPRHLFYGNVNLHSLGALAPDGYALHCEADGQHCRGFDAFGGRLFAARPPELAPRDALAGTLRDVVAATRPVRRGTRTSVALLEQARVPLRGEIWNLVHGVPLALAPDEWLEVELDVRVVGEGAVELDHHLRFPRRRDALRLPVRLESGERLRLRYTFAAGAPVSRITCGTEARVVAGDAPALEFAAQRLSVLSGAGAPPAGVVVALLDRDPAGGPPVGAEQLSGAEIDAIARSMLGSAGAAQGPSPGR